MIYFIYILFSIKPIEVDSKYNQAIDATTIAVYKQSGIEKEVNKIVNEIKGCNGDEFSVRVNYIEFIDDETYYWSAKMLTKLFLIWLKNLKCVKMLTN